MIIKNCQNCAAPLSLDVYQDMLTCHYCDTVHVASLAEHSAIEKLEGVATGSRCSVCSSEFSHAKIDSVAFLYCGSCEGLLVDQAELLKLILYVRADKRSSERPPGPVKQEDLEREIKCPLCQARMHTHEYYGPGDFVIDSCTACRKIWLDGGELSLSSTVKWSGTKWS